MNAINEPRLADVSIFASLQEAEALIEAGHVAAASALYRSLLERDLAPSQRGEVLTNLGAALCLAARGRKDPAGLAQLNQARDLLTLAIACRPRRDAPAAWAISRANLALVYLARCESFGNATDLLSAHLALDGTEKAARELGDAALLDWLTAIRDHLAEMRERRRNPR